MRKSTLKMTALFISVMIIAAVAGACATKGNDSAINTAGISNATKAATTTKTATKAVTVSAAASAAKTTAGNTSDGTPAGGGTDMAGAGATGTGTIDDNEGQDNTDGMAEDSSGDGGSQTAEEKTFDLKGRKILVIASPLTQAWQNPVPDPADKVNDLRYRRMKEAEELFNCTFVFEQPAGMTTPAAVSAKFYQNIMAGVYWGDIFRMGDNNVFPAFEKANLLLAMSDYMDFTKPAWAKFSSYHVYGLFNPDKVYSVFDCIPAWTYGVFYNQEILAREGFADLCNYKDEGRWTWDMFLDIAIRTTKDFNGDGIVDQWGTGSSSKTVAAQFILYSNLAVMIEKANGSFTYNLASAKASKALQFLSDLYSTYKVMPNKNAEGDFKKYTVAMLMREAYNGAYYKTGGLQNIRFEEMPLGPDNPGNTHVQNSAALHHFYFPVNLEDAEGVVNAYVYWHLLWDDSNSEYVTFNQILEANAKVRMFDPDIERYINSYTNKSVVLDEFVTYFAPSLTLITAEIFNKIADTGIVPYSQIEAIRPEIESIIQEVMR